MKRSFRRFETRLDRTFLRDKLEARALKLHVTLRDLYDGPRTTSVVTARRDAYLWLRKQGKGINEIARLFDRAPSGIFQMTRER